MQSLQENLNALAQETRVQYCLSSLETEELYIVGGALRDLLRGKSNADIDLASNLPPELVKQRLEAKGCKVIPTGLQHQTVTVLTPVSGRQIEITTFRSSGISSENPIQLGESIEEDLAYRDFTMNALALRVCDQRFVDPFQGSEDIKAALIRAVGHPKERFEEDPLRMLRAVRFASCFDFELEAKTAQAITANAEKIRSCALERIRDELSKLLMAAVPSKGVSLLYALQLIQHILPELDAMDGFEQNDFHHLDLLQHTLLVLDSVHADLTLRLAALLHDIGKMSSLSVDENGNRHFYKHEHIGAQEAQQLLERLRFSKEQQKRVSRLVKTHMRPLSVQASGMRRLLRDTAEDFSLWRELKEADASACKLEESELARQLAQFDELYVEVKAQADVSPLKNLAVNGNDLIALGVEPGPVLGRILHTLHEEVLDQPERNTRECLLVRAKELL